MPALHSLAAEFQSKADFVIVYIAEAHASDVWPISSARYAHDGKPVDVAAPTTTAERCAVADRFRRDYDVKLQMLVDGVEDGFERAMAPWPLRFYGLEAGLLGYIAQPEGCSYALSGLRDWLLERG